MVRKKQYYLGKISMYQMYKINMKVLQFLMGTVSVTSQLISMLFLHVPTPFTFFGMTSGAVQEKQ